MSLALIRARMGYWIAAELAVKKIERHSGPEAEGGNP
jgi:hypothetical protein